MGRSELDHGQAVPAETCRRIACDAPHVMVTHGPDGHVLDVSRKARNIPLPLWRALAARDRTCRFPGCTRTGRLQAHHIEHCAKGGETSPDNLILLCKAHHWAVHEGGGRIEGRPPGPIAFIRPDGRPLPAVPSRVHIRGDGAELLRQAHRALGLDITAETTARHLWDGEPMDYDMAVDGLMSLRAGPEQGAEGEARP